MMASPWDKAIEKQRRRRALGLEGFEKQKPPKQMPYFTKLSRLYNAISETTGLTSYDTLALAVRGGNKLVAAVKVQDLDDHQTFVIKNECASVFGEDCEILTPGEDWEEFLHAEMRIMRHLGNYEGEVVIYCAKGVCPDCWGWLNAHGVTAYPPRKSAASQWFHPTKGALYWRSNNDLVYYKNGMKYTVGNKHGTEYDLGL
jgi:hypothetical protein